MAQVEGEGPIRAASILAELDELAELIDDLVLQAMRTADDPQADVARDNGGTAPLAGMRVVITGAVPGLTRKAAQRRPKGWEQRCPARSAPGPTLWWWARGLAA